MNSLTPLLLLVLAAANLPLLAGSPATALVFDAGAIAHGQWWRLITHPFVHVSLYHAVLDAGAFLLLWALRPQPRRLATDAAMIGLLMAGSLAGAWWVGIPEGGFCGLSGVAHGLMAWQGAAWMRDRDATNRRIGWIVLMTVLVKSLAETLTGTVVLAGLHPGVVGTPIAACHLGGALAGLCGGLRSTRVCG
jgi:rhomboid family GlyGly-CTERM serine protease